MRILVVGGTVFLSRAVAEAALARGHEVTCACRGASGPVPEGAAHVPLDREAPDWEGLRDAGSYDAVVDVARHPGWVQDAVAQVPDAHWVFVSTINVYADDSIPGGSPDTLAVREPLADAGDDAGLDEAEAYGARKVACEQAVLAGAASATVVRPGLVVGPGDPSGRFSYWPLRVAEGGEVLAPGEPDDAVQVIDVRDLAEWVVECAEERRAGTFDGSGKVTTRQAFLDEVARGVGAQPTWTWVPQEFLVEQEVAPWSGPRSVPVWLPLPEYAGLMAHDVDASYAAGLRTRPLADTARDTLAWLAGREDPHVTGINREDEAAVLRAWHAASGESGQG